MRRPLRTCLLAILVAWLCAACATSGGGNGGSVDMYGTIDNGITLHSH